jgi:ABC-type nickel/cobalt efflux system permease component RcnA
MTRRRRRSLAVLALLAAGVLASGGAAQAHPLGNFTTNTAARVVVRPDAIEVRYAVDLAEIPTLRYRQTEGLDRGTTVNAAAGRTCSAMRNGFDVTVARRRAALVGASSAAWLVDGQAGLQTLRIDCVWRADVAVTADAAVAVRDRNFDGRFGWREVTVVGDRMTVTTDAPSVSPSAMLSAYPAEAATDPLTILEASFTAVDGGPALVEDGRAATAATRPTDSVSARFQSLIGDARHGAWFVVGALAIAMVLGGLHALAPGHGKTLMAAYAVGRRGGRREMLVIGGVVALTHTTGVLVLGVLASTSSAFSPTGTLRWSGIISALIVFAVGVNLLRVRWRSPMLAEAVAAGTTQDDHDHGHGHHDHGHHDHGHGHHDHGHGHDGHRHGHRARRPSPRPWWDRLRPNPAVTADPRFVVTSHRHGGVDHTHVLPAVGASVPRRELLAMGLAGGLVPSPSALLVLIAAVALGRIGLGLGLVGAYGVGLAVTLVGTGLLLARAEHRLRSLIGSRNGPATAVAVRALPLVSAVAVTSAGVMLLVRSIGSF